MKIHENAEAVSFIVLVVRKLYWRHRLSKIVAQEENWIGLVNAVSTHQRAVIQK
jgi:hypothetical protein